MRWGVATLGLLAACGAAPEYEARLENDSTIVVEAEGSRLELYISPRVPCGGIVTYVPGRQDAFGDRYDNYDWLCEVQRSVTDSLQPAPDSG